MSDENLNWKKLNFENSPILEKIKKMKEMAIEQKNSYTTILENLKDIKSNQTEELNKD